MKKLTLIHNPISVTDLKYDDTYDEFESDWHLKAERLIQRREKRLRLKGA